MEALLSRVFLQSKTPVLLRSVMTISFVLDAFYLVL